MYAVINSGGKQYKVSVGDKVKIEKVSLEPGQTVEFEPLAIKKSDGILEFYKGKVVGEVLSQGKHRKVIVFKFRAKKNYKRWRGHRQPYTEILIKDIKEA